MKTASIRDAKAHLNELVALAEKGEDVVLMRGSKIVACIKPMSEKDLAIEPVLTDAQAERFWKETRQEIASGKGKRYPSFPEEVNDVGRPYKTGPRS